MNELFARMFARRQAGGFNQGFGGRGPSPFGGGFASQFGGGGFGGYGGDDDGDDYY